MASVDVIYALHMKPGDLYAGKINPDVPTIPLQPFARAHCLSAVTPYIAEDGDKMLHLEAGGCELEPIRTTMQVLLIRR